MRKKSEVFCLDCLKGMKKLDDNSVDLVVTLAHKPVIIINPTVLPLL